MNKKMLASCLFGAILATAAMTTATRAAEEETAGNNLSFPVIAVDGFSITPLTEFETSFSVPYTGPYTGLTDEEIAALEASGPWYAQKTEGNVWQAEFKNAGANDDDVTYIDWGDNIESVDPKLRRPFRLEVTLYKELELPMKGYTMAVLANPSSPDEVQGTNTVTYESEYATVISTKPQLVIQNLTDYTTEELIWAGDEWVVDEDNNGTVDVGEEDAPPLVPVSFAPELNVGGKYIFGASEGGWKPTAAGTYRLTFYIPTGSTIDLTKAMIANASDGFATVSTDAEDDDEGGEPVVDATNNLTYVDVEVVAGGGNKPASPGSRD